ncbi:MAG: DUF2752 domain-containing protein [Lachnospiraceae bacterium]|nr:DUF2752 domain-containing protein [Lachnospiraceae bacterium]
MNIFETIALWLEYKTQNHICLFHHVTGYYCPGCGGTRAVIALLKGKLITSFIYHPLVPYSLLAFIYVIVHFIFCKIMHKNYHFPTYTLWLALVILILNWIIKNIAPVFLN